MKKINFAFIAILLFSYTLSFAQETENNDRQPGHTNQNKFKQLKEELATPNSQHTASGAPGVNYTQQQVDYEMDVVLDEENQKLSGEESITYHNNSDDTLTYLWVQLEQNKRAKDSKSPDIEGGGPDLLYSPEKFATKFIGEPFDGGFNIVHIKDRKGNPLNYTINRTMMRVELPKPLASGKKFKFNIKWWYNINNHVPVRDRSGYEHFPKDGNNLYVIAQFYPRLAVYNNVEGWQNLQFWGGSEFALEFGDFKVNITTPKDHILNATGVLKNPKKVLTKTQYERFKKAQTSFDEPYLIITQKEAEEAEKTKSKEQKTWTFDARNVRDFAFASSRKFIWDGMAVNINGKTVMAYSLYPKEGNPLWEKFSTKVVAHSLKEYSKYTFDYPYHKAISVHSKNQGMEYPQICWNYGRPRPDGTYSDRTRDAMIGVITHEVGHNFFPMIVNSDERQWAWMDEGINSFIETLTELSFDKNFNTGNLPKDIIPYMTGDQSNISPIMTQADNIQQLGPNAYTKPAAGLYMLRKTILGEELFDYAFRTYSQRWMFKHPTPEDFFRTMEDASGMDLDWFWRGWFYTTDVSDIGIQNVDLYRITNKPTKAVIKIAKQYGVAEDQIRPSIYLSTDSITANEPKNAMDIKLLSNYIDTKYSRRADAKIPSYFYEITFNKPGGLVMPIIVEYTYEDDSKERITYPAKIWRKNDQEVKKIVTSNKKIKTIVVDPDLETADVDPSNNLWPRAEKSEFDKKKEALKK
ncbi:M1 family metallopeptidase [Flavicella sediminum]|uniref:M1 family metallopeptidase n=1 Tax=Flavicella sediminum TaxID=2585141 RepID=UPI001124A7D1|nr:M1 family metallopeptidase [Flavicella sediminum]